MQVKDYRFDDLFQSRTLKGYFKRVEDGSDEIITSPYFERLNLNEWYYHLVKLIRSDVLKIPGLLEFETEMAEKVGPLSVMKPLKERMPDLEAYYSLSQLKAEPVHEEAINRFLIYLPHRLKDLKPRSIRETASRMRLNTNSGAPYFTKRSAVLEHTILDAEKFINSVDLNILEELNKLVAILGWRGQEGGPDIDDIKQRVIWMFPFLINLLEMLCYQRCIEAWQYYQVNSAYLGNEAVNRKITDCFDTKDPKDPVICTDFSKFDQHINPRLQYVAATILEKLLDRKFGEWWLDTIFPIKYEIPIAITSNRLLTGFHGMASGSAGTNFDECLIHGVLQHEAAYIDGAHLNIYSNAYGDDGYLTYPGITVDRVIECYTRHGLEMNLSKQYVSTDSAVYLRRYYHTNYRNSKGIMLGMYSTCRALGKLMYQERYFSPKNDQDLSYLNYTVLRAWSIIENCSDHPYFEEFVDYVYERDKYKLGLAIPGFMENVRKWFHKARLLDPNILGYTKELSGTTGITEWRVFKYLMSKA